MRTGLIRFAEIALLFGALIFTLPYIPSHEIATLPLMPSGAFAVALFACSRVIRWNGTWYLIAIETLAFAVFILIANQVANLLY